MVRNQITEFT